MAQEDEDRFELADGESIVTSCTPARLPRWWLYLATLGLYEFWRRVNIYAVTNRRITFRRGRVTNTENSLPLFYVQDAAILTFLRWGRVRVSTAGGEGGELKTPFLPKVQAQALRRTILELAHHLREERLTRED